MLSWIKNTIDLLICYCYMHVQAVKQIYNAFLDKNIIDLLIC
jgi:hypothetical protein